MACLGGFFFARCLRKRPVLFLVATGLPPPTSRMNREPERPARRQSGTPRRRIFAVEGRALDVHLAARIERDRRQANRAQCPGSVVEAFALDAVESESMDHAG